LDAIGAYRGAKLLLDEYGDAADIYAVMRADELEAAGDEAGRRAWTAILAAIDELRRTARSATETVH
jgi:pyruvate dehydrogenase complex dehydrogenase (E1) component